MLHNGCFLLATRVLLRCVPLGRIYKAINWQSLVLIAPVAFGIAELIGIAPQPLLMAVALSASSAFATPVASPVNTLVLGSGKYRFSDFVKVGLPLQALVMAVTIVVVPMIFPF